MKLLKLENKLLKDDITNKQKFIDTLLQHNSRLSQNFDISSIISTENDARKQPHGWLATVSPSAFIGMGMAVGFCCTLETIYHPNFYQ